MIIEILYLSVTVPMGEIPTLLNTASCQHEENIDFYEIFGPLIQVHDF